MSIPVVSVILQTYNRAGMLRGAIESVFAQTFTDWELIIVDDGSTDETPQIVESYQQGTGAIRYIRLPHQGFVKTRAAAVAQARGTYVTLLDDDDVFLPGKLARQVAFLDANPEFGLVYSSVDLVDGDGRFLERLPHRPAHNYLELVEYGCVISGHAALVRRVCFDRVGGFRDDLPTASDYDMWLRIGRAFPIAFLPDVVGLYRRHGDNLTTRYTEEYATHRAIYHELGQRDNSAALRTRLARAHARLNRELAIFHYKYAAESLDARRYGVAAWDYFQAVRHDAAVGHRIGWGAGKSRAYRLLRPYAAAMYCAGAALTTMVRGRPTHAAR